MSYRLHQPSYIKEILDKFGFKFSKALGQNFLIDGNLIENIIDYSEITEDDYVIEIGPGFGTLTERLVDKCKFLYSIEIDSRLMDVLKYTVGDRDNFQIINEDVLKVDLNELNHGDKKFKVVANLPYYITTPIIEYLFNYRDIIESITVMVQKEVANRMVAEVGSKDYASLSLFVKQNSDAKIILNAPKTVFMPQPKVDSAVVNMKLKKLDEDIDQELLRQLIRSGFSKRRKTILNSFTSGFVNVDKEKLKSILQELGLKENLRAENLSLEDYKNIVKKLNDID